MRFPRAFSKNIELKKQKTRWACCASGPMSTFSSESLGTTQRARHVAVMMMVPPMRPEMIRKTHLLSARLAEPSVNVNLC
jgi:hypothetical protein